MIVRSINRPERGDKTFLSFVQAWISSGAALIIGAMYNVLKMIVNCIYYRACWMSKNSLSFRLNFLYHNCFVTKGSKALLQGQIIDGNFSASEAFADWKLSVMLCRKICFFFAGCSYRALHTVVQSEGMCCAWRALLVEANGRKCEGKASNRLGEVICGNKLKIGSTVQRIQWV